MPCHRVVLDCTRPRSSIHGASRLYPFAASMQLLVSTRTSLPVSRIYHIFGLSISALCFTVVRCSSGGGEAGTEADADATRRSGPSRYAGRRGEQRRCQSAMGPVDCGSTGLRRRGRVGLDGHRRGSSKVPRSSRSSSCRTVCSTLKEHDADLVCTANIGINCEFLACTLVHKS